MGRHDLERGGVRVPASYKSDAGPKLSLQSLQANLTPSYSKKFDDEPLTLTLTMSGNAEAVRQLARFFDLYGQGEEFRARGYLPAAPPLEAVDVVAEIDESKLPPLLEASFEEGEDDG